MEKMINSPWGKVVDVPFISEVEEFNELMGKGNCNRTFPTVGPRAEWEFVYEFLHEELEEYRTACREGNIVEIADALGDLMYVLCNGILIHGLKNNFLDLYAEIQRSNLSKLCKTEAEAIESAKTRSKEKGYDVHYEKIGDYYVLYRSSDRKVQKSLYFSPPDLKTIIEKSINSNKF